MYYGYGTNPDAEGAINKALMKQQLEESLPLDIGVSEKPPSMAKTHSQLLHRAVGTVVNVQPAGKTVQSNGQSLRDLVNMGAAPNQIGQASQQESGSSGSGSGSGGSGPPQWFKNWNKKQRGNGGGGGGGSSGGKLEGANALGGPPFLPPVPANATSATSAPNPIMLVVILGALGVGGWYLWHKFHKTAAEDKIATSQAKTTDAE